jgi:hypothetical protein
VTALGRHQRREMPRLQAIIRRMRSAGTVDAGSVGSDGVQQLPTDSTSETLVDYSELGVTISLVTTTCRFGLSIP